MIIINHLQSCINDHKKVYIFYICEFVILFKIAVIQLPGADSHHVTDAFDIDISMGGSETEINYDYEDMLKSFQVNDSPLSKISVKPCKKMVDCLPYSLDDIEIDQNEAEMVLKI